MNYDEKKKTNKVWTLTFFSGLVALMAGCSTPQPDFPEPELVEADIRPTEEFFDYNFDKVDIPETIQYLQDKNCPERVITFARSLSRNGRNRESASIYLDVANRFKSKSGRFESDCKKAAVREYWLDGDFKSAKKLLDELEAEQDIYTAACEAESLKKLRILLETANVSTAN